MIQSPEVNASILSFRRGTRSGSVGVQSSADFENISKEMARLAAQKNKIIIEAFSALEDRHKLLAEMLILHFGSQDKAARWMCSRQPCFDGRTGYDVIVAGELDMIWDEITTKSVLAE